MNREGRDFSRAIQLVRFVILSEVFVREQRTKTQSKDPYQRLCCPSVEGDSHNCRCKAAKRRKNAAHGASRG